MSVAFEVTVLKSSRGYETVDEGPPGPAGSVLARGGTAGIKIAELPGGVQPATYSTADGLRVWEKLLPARNAADLAKFMNEWGPLSKRSEAHPYYADCHDLLERVGTLRELRQTAEGNEISSAPAVQYPMTATVRGGTIVCELRTLFDFALFEMINDLWSERSTVRRARVCAYCGKPFEPTRSDQKYCPGRSCANMASRAKQKRATTD